MEAPKLVMHLQTSRYLSTLEQGSGAVLLHGEFGVGKRTLALEVARRLNCLGCSDQSCASCRQVAGRNHPNISVVEPDAKGKIGIEAAQELQHDLQYAQYQDGRRVIIIADADTLTIPAANSLLKVIEEPPPDTLIIITAISPSALLDTIVSRCRPIFVAKPTEKSLVEFLVNQYHQSAAAAQELVQLSRGLPGLAVSLAMNEDAWEQHRQARALAEEFSQQTLFGRLQIVAKLGKDPIMTELLLQSLTQLSRVLTRSGEAPGLQSIIDARLNIKANVAPKMALEALAVRLP
ncbi:MAG TPA: AAA family ATPase [Candidatus Saccharimonadales bacterium]|nr:AAA family ATPase [Candidatus Saccharimonadales bacterium]